MFIKYSPYIFYDILMIMWSFKYFEWFSFVNFSFVNLIFKGILINISWEVNKNVEFEKFL